MAVWPVSLQQTLSIPTTEVQQQAFVRTQMDAGPYKQRARFTTVSRFLTTTMTFDKTDRQTFDTFYNTTLNYGTDEFDFYDPVDNSTVQMRFTAPPRFTAIAGGGSGGGAAQWRVSMQLEILP